MATLAADKPRQFEVGFYQYEEEIPMIAADIVYAGGVVGELNDTGTGQPLNTGSTVDKFRGFAVAKADNSAGAASAINVKVRTFGRVLLDVTGVASAADVGKTVWATDDDTFTLTYAAGAISIGKVRRWVTSTTCWVEFKSFYMRQEQEFTFADETVDLATDRVFYLATIPVYVNGVDEIHSVAAGGASVLQVTKDVTTDAPGAGTDMLSNNTNGGFDLNATANTVQNGTLKTTAGLRKLNAGDRLSIDFAQAVQSTAGLKIGVRFTPL